MTTVRLFERRELPPRRVGEAKPGFDLAEGAELAQAGQTLATFAGARFDKLVNSMAANEVAEFEGMVNTEIENFSTFVKSKPGAPFKELEAERNKMIQRLESVSAKAITESGRQSIKNFMLSNKNLIFAKTQNNMEAIRTRQVLQVSELHIKNFMASGNIDGLEKYYEKMVSAGFYTKEFATAKFAAEEAIMLDAAKKLAIENIKPLLVDSIGENLDKGAGLETLGMALSQLKKDGILTDAEAAQTDKVLGDWIDNFVAGRGKQAEDAEKLSTRETYIELSKDIVSGALTFDSIDQSVLLKDDKEKWQEYITGSYQDAPTENTPAGHTEAVGAVYDAATLQLSPTDAYDVLLKARFTDRTITDEQFEWGIGKIENPYPKEILEDIRSVFNSNLEDFNRIFKADKERNKKVNESLLAWVDKVIEQDKVPLFDFKKKMHAMSSQFRVGNARWYDIGQLIQRGGRNWEVVGFDENGEPLVEEVQ